MKICHIKTKFTGYPTRLLKEFKNFMGEIITCFEIEQEVSNIQR
jgi:hypothetical protein